MHFTKEQSKNELLVLKHAENKRSLTVNFALSSMTSYPSTVGVMGLSSHPSVWGGVSGLAQLEYSTVDSSPFILALVKGL